MVGLRERGRPDGLMDVYDGCDNVIKVARYTNGFFEHRYRSSEVLTQALGIDLSNVSPGTGFST